MNPSNPVSHASGEADTPYCWVIVATGNHGKWFVGIYPTEADADVELNPRGSGYGGTTYRKEPLYLGSTLSSLRAEHDALLHFAGRALKETRTEDIVGWDGGDLEEAMTESGLLELQLLTVPCHEGCRCQESYSAGEQAECYVFTDLAQRALKSLETSDPRSA